MKKLLLPFCLLLLLSACGSGKADGDDATDSLVDTIQDAMPPLPADVEDSLQAVTTISQAADGVFYDFISSFCQNSRYQKSRIAFPLQRTVSGIVYTIEQRQWHFSKLHFNSDAYTVFFPSSRDIDLEKADTIDTVTVQWYEVEKDLASNYKFIKTDGQWMLTSIDEHPIAEDKNSNFLLFYAHFASDPQYQAEHLADIITYDGIDPDSDDDFELNYVKNHKIPASDWNETLIPILPDKTFSNIDFGQDLSDATHERIVSLESPDSGFNSRLHFRRNGDTWLLHKIENY